MKKHNDQKINEVLKEFIDGSRLKPKLQQTRLDSIWKELMGPSISGYTKNLHMYRKKLYITIVSAPLKNELNYGREKIKNLLNEALGEEYIEEVVIR